MLLHAAQLLPETAACARLVAARCCGLALCQHSASSGPTRQAGCRLLVGRALGEELAPCFLQRFLRVVLRAIALIVLAQKLQ